MCYPIASQKVLLHVDRSEEGALIACRHQPDRSESGPCHGLPQHHSGQPVWSGEVAEVVGGVGGVGWDVGTDWGPVVAEGVESVDVVKCAGFLRPGDRVVAPGTWQEFAGEVAGVGERIGAGVDLHAVGGGRSPSLLLLSGLVSPGSTRPLRLGASVRSAVPSMSLTCRCRCRCRRVGGVDWKLLLHKDGSFHPPV
jgi:hypothetical protein